MDLLETIFVKEGVRQNPVPGEQRAAYFHQVQRAGKVLEVAVTDAQQ